MTVENPHAGQGSVVLDIGGEVGALVVTMPAELEGVEVEINRIDSATEGPTASHTGDHLHSHDHHHLHDHDQEHHHEHLHDHATHLPHVAVVARPTPLGIIHSLVFPELVEGTYELYRRPTGPVELTVTIRRRAVTEAAWPA